MNLRGTLFGQGFVPVIDAVVMATPSTFGVMLVVGMRLWEFPGPHAPWSAVVLHPGWPQGLEAGGVSSGIRSVLQRETLLRQLETNQLDMDATLEELSVQQETEDQNYSMYVPRGPGRCGEGTVSAGGTRPCVWVCPGGTAGEPRPSCPVGQGALCVSRKAVHLHQKLVGHRDRRARAPQGQVGWPCWA